MKHALYFLMLATALSMISLTGCSDGLSSEDAAIKLIGKWEWLHTDGRDISGQYITPSSEGYTMSMELKTTHDMRTVRINLQGDTLDVQDDKWSFSDNDRTRVQLDSRGYWIVIPGQVDSVYIYPEYSYKINGNDSLQWDDGFGSAQYRRVQ